MSSKGKHSRDVEEAGRNRRLERREEGGAKGTLPLPAPAAETPASLLNEPEMAHPSNAALRARAVTEVQRRRGNHVAQRLLQEKLAVSQPDDAYEREADRVADRVTAMSEPRVQTQPIEEEEEELQPKAVADQIAPLVQRRDELEEEELFAKPLVQRQADPEEEEEEEELIQPQRMEGEPREVADDLEDRIDSVRTGGHPLSTRDREFFEPRFGHDFGQVRIHTDSKAAEVARELGARAFTIDHDVVFGAGEHDPGTTDGKALLAHELTHVVQQTAPGRAQISSSALQRAPAPTTGTVTIKKPSYTSYTVAGDTLADVYKVLSTRTEWGKCNCHFSYSWTPDDGKIAKADVTLTPTIQLPKWAGLDKASVAAKKEWNRMLAALKTHELGHFSIGKKWAPQLKARLVGQATGQAGTIFNEFAGDAQEAQDSYDVRTKHGQNQGVSLDLSVK